MVVTILIYYLLRMGGEPLISGFLCVLDGRHVMHYGCHQLYILVILLWISLLLTCDVDSHNAPQIHLPNGTFFLVKCGIGPIYIRKGFVCNLFTCFISEVTCNIAGAVYGVSESWYPHLRTFGEVRCLNCTCLQVKNHNVLSYRCLFSFTYYFGRYFINFSPVLSVVRVHSVPGSSALMWCPFETTAVLYVQVGVLYTEVEIEYVLHENSVVI